MATKPKGYYSKGKVKSKDAVAKSNARKSLTSLKGIAGIVGGAVIEGIGGPKAKAAGSVLKYTTRTGARIIVDRKGAQIAVEKAARRKAPVRTNPKDDLRKDPGGSGGGNIYRAPGRNNRPRLRDTDNTPRKTTVRQKVGPKTKSGKFIEPKRKPTTNTQPPARTKTEKPKPLLPDVTKFKGRTIAINKRSANPRIRKRQEAQLRIARREFEAERQRQAKLAARREPKTIKQSDAEKDIPVYSKNGVRYTVRVPRSSKTNVEARPAQPTIESRLQSGAEKLDVTSRNASRPPQTSSAEWRRYAQQVRDSRAKSPNVTKAQIARGRDRALMSDKARRDKWLNEQRTRIVAKAKAKGMTDTQIQQAIARARAEANAIARKAAK